MFTLLVIFLTWLVIRRARLSGDISCVLITAMFMDFAIIMVIVGIWAGWW